MHRHTLYVLLASADKGRRGTLRRRLETAGLWVDTAACGAEVLVQCDFDRPDVLILDSELGDMDQYELCSQLRGAADESPITIILLTDASDDMTRDYAPQMTRQVGGDYFLARPLDLNLLIKLLEELGREIHPRSERTRRTFPTHVTWPTSRCHVGSGLP